jgi:hypothetical protein
LFEASRSFGLSVFRIAGPSTTAGAALLKRSPLHEWASALPIRVDNPLPQHGGVGGEEIVLTFEFISARYGFIAPAGVGRCATQCRNHQSREVEVRIQARQASFRSVRIGGELIDDRRTRPLVVMRVRAEGAMRINQRRQFRAGSCLYEAQD